MAGSGALEELRVIFTYFEQLAIETMGLPSGEFYRKLDDDYEDIKNYYKDCSSLFPLNKGRQIRIHCAQLVKYLKTKSRRLGQGSYSFDDCILLNYWIYGKFVNTYNSNYSPEFVKAWGMLEYLWNDIVDKLPNKSLYKICKPDSSITTQPYWKERKELYDYYVDFTYLKVTANNYQNCKEYYNYIRSKTRLYEHFEKYCSPVHTKICPDLYETYMLYKPDEVLHTLNCHDSIVEEEKLQKKELLQVKPAEANEVQESGVIGHGLSDSSKTSSSNNNIVTKTGNTLLAVVVTSMTSGALYRFTPLGSMLRNGFGRNNNMRNLNIGDNGLFDYTSESFNQYTWGGEEHYIGYQPA
ncbi:PIR protein [Plasmodium vivax]|uniref:VIR protein n=1 Tax=Plasmodium vivax TaxID=5855 RepID=A0A565A6S6_PLAVI|nr:PIR protein [Plasmodium vivax]